MAPKICPYLGLKDDADTALHYPAAGNHCHHARPLQPVDPEHQRAFCLSGEQARCLVYQRAALAPLPAGVRARQPLKLPGGRVWAAALVAAALLAGWLGLGGVDGLLGLLGGSGAIPVTGGSGVERTPFRPGAAYTRTPEATEGVLLAFSPSPNPTRASCPPPVGWGSYLVNPTDSLLRLSVLYNLPLEDLLAANCLAADAVVQPGEVLYVPLLATPTASPSPTVTVFVPPPAPVVIVQPSATQPPPPEPPQPEPTQAPPTATATNAPPTQAPPTVAPTDPPTPTEPPPPTQAPTEPDPPTPEPTVTDPPITPAAGGAVLFTATATQLYSNSDGNGDHDDGD
ncbi:MAG TPA: LysM domain-containing protein, partial [Anaerolineaceae bacterium]|nr:LysM domain-containing protein [Anaerolineaceae bacterium]